MKNLLFMFAILLLVSCNKEEDRAMYGKWEVYYAGVVNNTAGILNEFEYNPGIIKITKDSWEPLIQGKVTAIDGELIQEVHNNEVDYYYEYYLGTDEIKLDAWNIYSNKLSYRYYLKRI